MFTWLESFQFSEFETKSESKSGKQRRGKRSRKNKLGLGKRDNSYGGIKYRDRQSYDNIPWFSFEDGKYLLRNLRMQPVTDPTQTSQRGNDFELPSVILWHAVHMGLKDGGDSDELLFG